MTRCMSTGSAEKRRRIEVVVLALSALLLFGLLATADTQGDGEGTSKMVDETGAVVGTGPQWLVVPAEGPRLVLLIDIDGIRQDVIYDLLVTDPERVPNLSRIVGEVRTPGADSMTSYWAHSDSNPMRAVEFENAIAMLNATTVFPSYTFCAQASIATGQPPAVHGIPGNEWVKVVSRAPNGMVAERRLFGFTGDDLQPGWGDAPAAYAKGLANEQLLAQTVYQQLGPEVESHVVFHMYYTGANWHPIGATPGYSFETWKNYGMYYLCPTTDWFDQKMTGQGLLALDSWWNRLQEQESTSGSGVPEKCLTMLYYNVIDHRGHSYGVQSHRTNMIDVVDAEMGRLYGWVRRAGLLGRTTFVIVADHGQTDLSNQGNDFMSRRWVLENFFLNYTQDGTPYTLDSSECRVRPAINAPVVGNVPVGLTKCKATHHLRGDVLYYPRFYCAAGDPCCRAWPLADSNVIMAVNGGSAHVYVLNDVRSNERIEEFAALFFDGFARLKPFNAPLVLLRYLDPEGGDPSGGRPYYAINSDRTVVPLLDYWSSEEGRRRLSEWGWQWPDAPKFITRRIEQMNCERSGDIVLICDYPEMMFESGACPTNHGSLRVDDMFVPLIIARPPYEGGGYSATSPEDESRELRQELYALVQRSLGDTEFVSNMDAARIIRNIFDDSPTGDWTHVPGWPQRGAQQVGPPPPGTFTPPRRQSQHPPVVQPAPGGGASQGSTTAQPPTTGGTQGQGVPQLRPVEQQTSSSQPTTVEPAAPQPGVPQVLPLAADGCVRNAAICTGIDAGNRPTGANTQFPAGTNELFLVLNINDAAPNTQLTVDWYRDGQRVSSRLNLVSGDRRLALRTYSLDGPLQPGVYSVELLQNGRLVGRLVATIAE